MDLTINFQKSAYIIKYGGTGRKKMNKNLYFYNSEHMLHVLKKSFLSSNAYLLQEEKQTLCKPFLFLLKTSGYNIPSLESLASIKCYLEVRKRKCICPKTNSRTVRCKFFGKRSKV